MLNANERDDSGSAVCLGHNGVEYSSSILEFYTET
jgi:hypothetical protein